MGNMLHFDEVIWRLNRDLKTGREIVHYEKDVNYDEASLGDEDKLKMLVRSLIGQDAQCAYADKLTILSFQPWDNCIWVIASDCDKGHYAYSVLLSFIK